MRRPPPVVVPRRRTLERPVEHRTVSPLAAPRRRGAVPGTLDRHAPAPYTPGAAGSSVRTVPAAPVRPKPSLFLLVAMTGLGPFTMQIVIPSMPVMAAALAVPYGTVQLTLTLYLIGVALGQLLYGPLSDRYGRKPLLLAGLGFYLLGSAIAAAAPTAGVLIVARVLQAAGGCAGLVPAFRAYCGVVSLSTGVFFAFASGTPVVVVNGMGHPPTHLAAAMMLLAVSWSAGTFTTARLSVRLGVSRLLRLGTGLILAGGLLAVLLLAFAPPNIFLFFLPMMVMAFGNGVAQPSAIGAALSVRPGLAGTASGLVGALQMGFGALMTVAAGATEDGRGGATVACMLLCAVGTQAFLRGVPKRG